MQVCDALRLLSPGSGAEQSVVTSQSRSSSQPQQAMARLRQALQARWVVVFRIFQFPIIDFIAFFERYHCRCWYFLSHCCFFCFWCRYYYYYYYYYYPCGWLCEISESCW